MSEFKKYIKHVDENLFRRLFGKKPMDLPPESEDLGPRRTPEPANPYIPTNTVNMDLPRYGKTHDEYTPVPKRRHDPRAAAIDGGGEKTIRAGAKDLFPHLVKANGKLDLRHAMFKDLHALHQHLTGEGNQEAADKVMAAIRKRIHAMKGGIS